MDFTISDPSSLRTLSRTIQTAAKLAEHVQFTPNHPSLHLRLLTPTHSTSPSYKISTRILLPLLRAPHTISTIRLHPHANRLRLTVLTQSGLTKRFLIPLIDGRISSIRASTLANTLQSSPAFLNDLLANFHAKLDEITLIPSTDAITLVSFVDDASNPSNAFLRTEITVDAHQFEHHLFSATHPSTTSQLTFLCRPLRTVVEYSDSLDIPIRLRYGNPGGPLNLELSIQTPSGDPHFNATFVFSTRTAGNTQLNTAADASIPPSPHPERPSSAQRNVRPLHMQTETELPETQMRPTTPNSRSQLIPQPSQTEPLPPVSSQQNLDALTGRSPEPRLLDPFNASAIRLIDVDDDDDDDFVDATPPP